MVPNASSTGPGRGHRTTHFGVHREPRRPQHCSSGLTLLSTYIIANVTASRQPKSSQYRPFWTDVDAFGAPSGPSGTRRPNGLRARAPLVAISSVRSDPRRSKRVLGVLLRSQLSAVSSDDLTVICRELARPRRHQAPRRADEGAAQRFRRAPMALEACSGGLYSESSPAHTVDQLEALRTNIALGLGDEFALRPQPNPKNTTAAS